MKPKLEEPCQDQEGNATIRHAQRRYKTAAILQFCSFYWPWPLGLSSCSRLLQVIASPRCWLELMTSWSILPSQQPLRSHGRTVATLGIQLRYHTAAATPQAHKAVTCRRNCSYSSQVSNSCFVQLPCTAGVDKASSRNFLDAKFHLPRH